MADSALSLPAIPEATRVIAVRHGETAWNAQARMQGQLDIALNALGRRQAVQVGAALAHERIDAIFSSDLGRALQTAEPLAQRTGLRVRLDPGLRERCFGDFQGLTFDEVQARWPDDSRRWRQREPDFAPEGAESLRVFAARAVAAAARIAGAHAGQTVVLLTHGGVLDCLYRAAARVGLQSPRTWLLANAGINRLLYTEQGFTLVGWADAGHLDDITLDDAGEATPPSPGCIGCAARAA